METLGTTIITVTAGLLGKADMSPGLKALGVAAVLMPLIHAGARVSGANYNPSISVALLLLGKMPPAQCLFYISCQLVGALIGGVLTKVLLPQGAMDPSSVGTIATCVPEALFSFALILTALQTTVSKSQSRNSFFGSAISIVVFLGVAFGAGMNPAVAGGLFAGAGHQKGLLARTILPLIMTFPAAFFFRLTDIDETYAREMGLVPSVSAAFVRAYGPYLIELVGSFLLTTTIGLALVTKNLPIPLAAGLALTFLAFGSGYVSGAHLNPAVSLGVYLRNARRIRMQKLAGYASIQVLGALASGAMLRYVVGAGALEGRYSVPRAVISCGQAFAVEALFTCMMVSTILHINASTGYQGNQCNGLVVGLALMGGLLITDVVGGGLLNPAAVLGLSVSNVAFERHARRRVAIFIGAPFVGAILGNLTVMLTSPPEIGKK